MKKTIAITMTALTLTAATTFAADAPGKGKTTTVAAAAQQSVDPKTYNLTKLFTHDGCTVYEFYRNGQPYLLATGTNSICALNTPRQ